MFRIKLLIFGILVFPCYLYATDLPQGSNLEVIDDFSAGLNTQTTARQLQKNETPNAENGLIDERPGSIVVRKGYASAGVAPGLSKINFMTQFIKNGGTREMIVSDSSQVLTTKDFTNFTVLKTTLTPSATLHSCQGRNKALFLNGVDPDFFYDGVNAISLDGNNSYPNVPIGKYCSFYQDRFWIYNTTNSNSALVFSALSSTDGFAIDSLTDLKAWPPTNQLNIGLGDGRDGTALDIFRGQLLAHKRNSAIFTIYGTDEFTYFARKTNAYTGTDSQDSIAQQDNGEYFHALEGIYMFDGQNTTRISDTIYPDMEAVRSNQSNVITVGWDTQADFKSGGGFFFTTATSGGFLQPFTSSASLNNIQASSPTTSDFITISSGVFPPPTIITTTESLSSQFYSDFDSPLDIAARVILWQKNGSACVTKIALRNTRTGAFAVSDTHIGLAEDDINFSQQTYYNFRSTSVPTFTSSQSDINNNFITYQITPGPSSFANPPENACPSPQTFKVFAPTTPFYADVKIAQTRNSEYTSQITTSTSLTSWDLFSSKYDTNGGTVAFYVKSATSLVTITTVTWSAISPGAIISFPASNTFIQWASSFTTAFRETPPDIDILQINYAQGGSFDSRPFATTWKGRYWLTVSTQANGIPVQYIKSRITNKNPNAWMKYTGINIKSVSLYGDNLYGGSASSGTIFRLDFGTNDNGNAINWFYDTPELNFASIDRKNMWFEKKLSELLVDTEVTSNATLTIGLSVNSGDFTYNTVDLSGNALQSLNNYSQSGRFFKFRFSNTQIDTPITFNNLGILYYPQGLIR